MNLPYRLEVASENAFILYFEQRIAADISQQVQQAKQQLQLALADILIDLLPSYASLLVVYNPLLADALSVLDRIDAALQPQEKTVSRPVSCIELPVYYSTESGPDLVRIAEAKDISVQQVIELHQATTYQVYAIGFAPGFAYLGEVAPLLEMPRLATPRARVPAGSVGIADRQTAIYPAASPGGWNLIGLCPVRMFDSEKTPPMPVAVGDQVKFIAISKNEFLQLGGVL